MATTIYPTSDENRILLLRKIIERAEMPLGASYLLATMVDNVREQRRVFRSAVHNVQRLLEQRARKIDLRNHAVDQLEIYHIGFRQGVLWRIRTDDFLDSYVHFFHITDSRLPDYISPESLDETIGHYIVGDRDAVAAGHPPMSNPSADDLRIKLGVAREAIAQATEASEEMDRAQHVLVPLREEVDSLIRLVNQQLDVTTHGLPTDDVRAIKRRFGFAYDTDETETEEEARAGSDEDAGTTSSE